MYPSGQKQQQPSPRQQQLQQQQQQQQPQEQQQQNMWLNPPPPPPSDEQEPVQLEQGGEESADSQTAGADRPIWMKSKLAGVKKISNRERRRRQNENLRKLITPKNALVILNEILPGENIINQFKVESEGLQQFFQKKDIKFHADLTVDGETYRGYGESKIAARNAAAEQAIRDLSIKQMSKYLMNNGGGANGDNGDAMNAEGDAEKRVEQNEILPMTQLASFALHKLFSEWQKEGHKVPPLRQRALLGELTQEMAGSPAAVPKTSKAPKPGRKKKPRELPADAAITHPCQLLAMMRPDHVYREVSVEGDNAQNILFTMSVEVDDRTFLGKGPNKKEARRLAAKAACEALLGVCYVGPQPQPVQS